MTTSLALAKDVPMLQTIPAEVRLRILKYIFLSDSIDVLPSKPTASSDIRLFSPGKAALEVCHQLRDEGLPVFFSNKMVTLHFNDDAVTLVNPKVPTEIARQVKTVVLERKFGASAYGKHRTPALLLSGFDSVQKIELDWWFSLGDSWFEHCGKELDKDQVLRNLAEKRPVISGRQNFKRRIGVSSSVKIQGYATFVLLGWKPYAKVNLSSGEIVRYQPAHMPTMNELIEGT